jgi:hypothetical protein
MMMMMRATARLISISSHYRESYWLVEHTTLCTCFDSRFRVHIHLHTYPISKNKKRMCSFSFNGLVEMKKTKCLREITTIYYKWNILLLSSNAIVEILFRWINIMSFYSFFFLHAFIHCLMLAILHCHQSHLHFLPTSQKFIISSLLK